VSGLSHAARCESARAFGADRRPKDLISLEIEGSFDDAYSQASAAI